MRILGIDFGERRTGIAVSDPMGWTAQGLETAVGRMDAAVARIARLTHEYGAEAVVVGYPLNMNGTAGFRAERTEEFIKALGEQIADKNVAIIKWDERLTSAEAARKLKEAGIRPGARSTREKGKLDVLSAAILLQSYLDSRRGAEGKNEAEHGCDQPEGVMNE